MQAIIPSDAVVAPLPPPVSSYDQVLNDAVLEHLFEKLKTELPLQQFLSVSGDILARLDEMAGKSEEISGQVQKWTLSSIRSRQFVCKGWMPWSMT